MHKQYGPIVRISPYELHVNDPAFLPVLYSGGTKRRDKYAWATRVFGGSGAAIATVSHDLHRLRRGAMNRYFSKESIRRLEPILKRNFEKLSQKLGEFKGTTKPLNVDLPFGAFTCDIITEYCFGKSHNWLDKPGFNEKFIEMMASVHEMSAVAKQFNFMILVDMLPDWFVEKQDAGMAAFIQFRRIIQIDEIKARRAKGEKAAGWTGAANTTIFDSILDSDLPKAEKETERLWQEAQVMCIAGTETTAWTLSVLTFYLLSNPEVMRKLRDELELGIPDISTADVEIKDLEKLPYLTPVGMSCGLVHLNPDIFPSPFEFTPERWLQDPHLGRYLCSFSRGSRQCVGINMAYAQLYLCVAGIFRRYGGPSNPGPLGYLELYETTHEDVKIQYDLFVPFPKMGSKGVRVLVR
ncbi:uncharacterized protein Z520_06063 [Fonsecaea multimorphosa CBS 102226]|uniref:Cytochrome P450 n=1 Tax=Fonsecaea multimorphosa CBS 102226 TaxID=1442371 RepID=A0A0D2K485_9EURO|nr:uncharacterized protein Z520_06063 [Fonsecaea multimorphosa CBS 102226]KIX97984.1 hypothetical protein Z520_06063 [Fonsecaea multimorphosa CBS 102226]